MLLILTVGALATPGFISTPSIAALLTSISFIGCVAVGMTFITLSGNIMSLCLGATLSASSLIFMAGLSFGVGPALALGLGFGTLFTAAQGLLVGYLRANPIIVSIAALALLVGSTDFLTGGQRIYSPGDSLVPLTGNLWGIPVEVLFLLASAGIGQIILSYSRFGRHLHMVGSNPTAARAAGVSIWRTVTGSYLLAGFFTALAGILLSARYGSGDMELGVGYDYDAIAAVLVGGTAIHGGEGSVMRTLLGVAVISAIQVVLLLYGFSQQMQYLMTGLIVLTVIMLHSLGERHS